MATLITTEPMPLYLVRKQVQKQILLRRRLCYLLYVLIPCESCDQDQQCSICLDDYQEAKWVQMPNCTHQFHGSCVLRWLMIHDTCPICQQAT
jgi:hypothetical protein